MFIEHNGDRDSYISMHSQHLYESISDIDSAEANTETYTTAPSDESTLDINTDTEVLRGTVDTDTNNTTIPRETVDESTADIDTEKNGSEVATVSRETVV